MRKRSALFLLVSSLLLPSVVPPKADGLNAILRQEDLRNPDIVVDNLKSEIGDKRKSAARGFFLLGVKYRRRAERDGNWEPVAKMFGESAIHLPRPIALERYAEAMLRMNSKRIEVRELRERSNILREAVDLYKSALAADDFLHELDESQRTKIQAYKICTEIFLKDNDISSACEPLYWLGVKR